MIAGGAVGIDLRHAFPRLAHPPLLGPYAVAQREIDGDAAIVRQLRMLKRALGSFYAQPGICQFEAKNINHHHTASFAVPSIVNRLRSHLFRPHAAQRRDAVESNPLACNLYRVAIDHGGAAFDRTGQRLGPVCYPALKACGALYYELGDCGGKRTNGEKEEPQERSRQPP